MNNKRTLIDFNRFDTFVNDQTNLLKLNDFVFCRTQFKNLGIFLTSYTKSHVQFVALLEILFKHTILQIFSFPF